LLRKKAQIIFGKLVLSKYKSNEGEHAGKFCSSSRYYYRHQFSTFVHVYAILFTGEVLPYKF